MYQCIKIIFFLLKLKFTISLLENEINLDCFGQKIKNVTLSAYFPDFEENELLDKKGFVLESLQDFLDGRTNFITLAMVTNLPYGTSVCIPELNRHFGKRLRFELRDLIPDFISNIKDNLNSCKRADVCVRSESDSYDVAVNRQVTLVFGNDVKLDCE